MEMNALAARVDGLIAAVISVPPKLRVDSLQLPRPNDLKLISQGHVIEFDRVDAEAGIMGALAWWSFSPRQRV